MVGFALQALLYGSDYKFRVSYKKHIIGDIIVGFEICNVEFVKITKKTKYLSEFNIFDRNLNFIDCENIKLTELPKYKSIDSFIKLTHFNCSKNKLTNVNELMCNYNLIWLNCSYNELKSIPKKMFSLEYWDFSNNKVEDNIDFINCPNLKYLLASGNKIKSVSNLSHNLEYLDLSDNPLEELKNLPLGLKYLLIVQTKLTKINLIELENLQHLDISINNLSSCVDSLPENLIYLNCSQCEITKLSNLPFTLENLVCVNNQIESLEMLPENLIKLNCDHNEITDLNNLPNSLEELVCSDNSITKLDNLPPNLIKLNYEKNLIDCNISDLMQFKNTVLNIRGRKIT